MFLIYLYGPTFLTNQQSKVTFLDFYLVFIICLFTSELQNEVMDITLNGDFQLQFISICIESF